MSEDSAVTTARPARRRRRGVLIGTLVVVTCIAASLGGLAAARSPGVAAKTPAKNSPLVSPALQSQPPLVSFASLRSGPPPLPAGVSLVARLTHDEPCYARPGGPQVGVVPGSWYGASSILLVMQKTTDGWLHVRLAQRPDGSTAWIREKGVILSTTPYRIVVDLKTTHLMLYKFNHLVMDAPAGVGTATDPTPTGHFFVAFFAPPPNNYDDYGPFLMYTSAHSNAIADWEGSGDAIIAIHGPIFAEAQIGTTGSYVSHGCIRIFDNDLVRMQAVPPGSPVDVID